MVGGAYCTQVVAAAPRTRFRKAARWRAEASGGGGRIPLLRFTERVRKGLRLYKLTAVDAIGVSTLAAGRPDE